MPVGLDTVLGLQAANAQGVAAKPPLTPDQLSSFIAVNADGTVSAFFGKMDMGQGVFVAIGQIVAEELDVPFKAVKVYHGRHRHHREPGRRLRLDRHPGRRQADARRRGRSAPRAGRDGGRKSSASRPTSSPSPTASSATATQESVLRRTDRRTIFQRPARVEQADRQRALCARQGQAEGPEGLHKIVGQPIHREDIAPKVFAQEDFVTDVKVPGMVHGRMIRPAVAGAVPVKVDESSIKDIPGAKVVWDKGFLGVVADKEWDAIKAAQQLKVEWSDAKPPFPNMSDALRPHPQDARAQEARSRARPSAMSTRRSRTPRASIEAEYEWPFQSHASMGPACARRRDQGRPGHALDRLAEAALHAATALPACSACRPTRCAASGCRVPAPMAATTPATRRWMRPCWRRRSAGRCGCNTRASRAPDGTRRARPRSTARAPRSTRRARSSPTSSSARAFSRVDVNTNESQPYDTLAGQLTGVPLKSGDGFGVPGGILRVRQQADLLGDDPAAARPRLAAAHLASARSGGTANPLRQRILHGRGGGTRSNVDPVEFRLRHIKDPRDIAVIKAAAEKAGWQSRPSPRQATRPATR